jgi:integrase
MPVGALFCVVDGPSVGRSWTASAARDQLRRLAVRVGVRRRFAPHQLRDAHAIEMAQEGVPLNIIQRQLGHTDLGSRRPTWRASTTPRSSTRCAPAARR